MTMVEVTSNDSIPGEAELLSYAANYMASRLFTARQRQGLNVLIDVTRHPLRVPVTRAMLARQKTGFGTKAPTCFEMTVSTASGVRDAAETIAHEMLHISQAVNGRLLIASKKTKVAGQKTMVEVARWMGGKPIIIDNLAWHLRPWEVEACHWQTVLVDEFLSIYTGRVADQPVQSPKHRQLGLYPVSTPSPAFVPAKPEPAFEGTAPDGPDSQPASSQAGAPADQPVRAAPDADSSAGQELSTAPAPLQTVPPAGVEMSDTPPATVRILRAAMPDRPVYPRPVIEVTVPGLDAPRALEREAMMKKLGELRERGLAAADDTE